MSNPCVHTLLLFIARAYSISLLGRSGDVDVNALSVAKKPAAKHEERYDPRTTSTVS
jgi:hypothetical protein